MPKTRKSEQRIVKAALRWYRRGGGFIYRFARVDVHIMVVSDETGARALEKACAAHLKKGRK